MLDKQIIGTPGFGGFVPGFQYQFGKTYGNATREILEKNPSLGKQPVKQSASAVWTETKTLTADERLSFPPVPGYTGYIPRSQDHYGHPFVETTRASLQSFQKLQHTNKVTVRVQNAHKVPAQPPKPKPVKEDLVVSGYTGFIPRLQNHFGETFPHLAKTALNDSSVIPAKKRGSVHQPIPGFTGFIPGTRSTLASTFGKATEVSYDAFQHRDAKGRLPTPSSFLPKKDLKKNIPIPGYKGHVPGLAFSVDSASAKKCLQRQ